MRRNKLCAVTLAFVTLTACTTSLSTLELTAKPEGTIDGLPYRVRDNIVVELYELKADGYELVAEKQHLMADPSHVLIMNVSGQALSNSETKVEYLADSTLKSVDLNSTSQADEALTNIGAAGKEYIAAEAALDKARSDSAKAAEAATESELTAAFTKDLGYVDAVNAVKLAEQQLLELPAGSAQSVRIAKENEIAVLRLKANEAARRAGVDAPY